MPKLINTEIFKEKAKQIHGSKYDYSKVNYVDAHQDICIICPKHGEFYQTPNSHLNGNGCPKCGIEKSQLLKAFTQDEFVQKVQTEHGDKYDVSKAIYKGMNTKVCVICPTHGEFWITPNKLIYRGDGCPKCGIERSHKKAMKTTKQFIAEAKQIHSNKYDYSKVEYKGNKTNICIICPEHGEFWQIPIKHIQGCGCPMCKRSKMEEDIANLLSMNNIEFIPQYTFKELFVNGHNTQHIDFYLPKYNLAIECQGEQHYEPIDFGGKGKDWAAQQLELTQNRDKRKYLICEQKGITILYFAKKKYNENIIIDKNVLIEKIQEYGQYTINN